MAAKKSFQIEKNKILAVVGTDTGVGKTIVTASLLAYLNQKELKAAVMKPLESGCAWDKKNKILIPEDALFLKQNSQIPEELNKINPFAFKAPLAPAVAAKLENKKINFQKIINLKNYFLKKYPYLVLEMAGGLLVPLTSTQTNLDLIQKLACEVLLVARAGLGTLNHSLLTLKVLEAYSIPVVGIILNHSQKTKDLSTKTNLKTLQSWTKVKVWGEFPYIANSKKKENRLYLARQFSHFLGEAFQKNVNWG